MGKFWEDFFAAHRKVWGATAEAEGGSEDGGHLVKVQIKL